MGIKDLWSILTPFCERKPLYELQGKKVAIDLSGWVCQAQCIAEYQVQPRMYLRNLYFRTSYLLLQDVNPVFVLEGEAPTLKYKTIAARNAIQFKGAKPRTIQEDNAPKKADKGRSRFHRVLKQCEEMLECMGLACITGTGEAEAMCAYLNEENMVEGCISQDSDCFAYGAHVVYRNFSISQQGAHAASGGSIDVYDIRKATEATGFGRNKVIALALLCGSDYNEGVFGIGKDSALKLFTRIKDEDILEHLRNWRKKDSVYESMERKYDDKNICAQCGHTGKKAQHTRSGCYGCSTAKGCNFTTHHAERQDLKNEINIRNKALDDEDFPNEELINEFLIRKDQVTDLDLQWKRPNMKNFIKFTNKCLQWEEVYCFEKFFPILTRWLITHPKFFNPKIDPTPDYIKKIRNPKGVGCYEIIWNCEIFKSIIPEEQLSNTDPIKLFSSIEPQTLIEAAFPNLVTKFNESKIKPKKMKKPKAVPTKKIKKVNTMDKYLIQNGEMDSSYFDEDENYDLDSIVDGIISQGLPQAVKNKLELLRKEMEESKQYLNTSSFFITDPNKIDLFEESFRKIEDSDEENEEEDKEIDKHVNHDKQEGSFFINTPMEIDLFEESLKLPPNSKEEEEEADSSELDNSFKINTVPLTERIKRRLDKS